MPAGNTTGYFRVWAWSPTAANPWNEITTALGVTATGATTYSLPWTTAVTAGTDWYIIMGYYDAGGALLGQDQSNAAFTVTGGNTPMVTAPNGGESWAAGSPHNVTWDMPAGNATGYFRVWAWSPTAVNPWNEITTALGVTATGATTYSLPWTTAVTAGTDWYIIMGYYDAGGALLSQDQSNAAFTVL